LSTERCRGLAQTSGNEKIAIIHDLQLTLTGVVAASISGEAENRRN